MQETIEHSAYTTDNKRAVKTYDLNYQKISLTRGVQGGIAMGAFLIVLHLVGAGDIIWLKFLKYILLGGILAVTFKRLQQILPDGELFKNAIIVGIYTTMVSAFTLSIISLAAASLGSEIGFHKFDIQSDSFANDLLISGVLFFETLVGGAILSFIILQALKSRPKGNRSI